MGYALSTTVQQPYDAVVPRVKAALGDQGFGILTEIDIRATMKAKLDADVPAQVILGACRPPLALAALQAEPSIGLLLPCNVVVRALDASTTAVEAVDPQTMVSMTDNPALQGVADDATQRLTTALASPSPTGSSAPRASSTPSSGCSRRGRTAKQSSPSSRPSAAPSTAPASPSSPPVSSSASPKTVEPTASTRRRWRSSSSLSPDTS